MSKVCESSISFGVGLLFGVLAGVTAGILFSPKSGEQMRNEIKKTVNCNINSDCYDIIKCKSVSVELLNKLKYTLESQITKINDAVKAGRMAAAKRREEIDSGYSY